MLQVPADQHAAQVLIRQQTVQMSLNSSWNKIMTDNKMNQTLLTPIMMSLSLSFSPSCFLPLCVFFAIFFFSFFSSLLSFVTYLSHFLYRSVNTQTLLEQGIDKRKTNSLWKQFFTIMSQPVTRTDSFFVYSP